MYNTNNKNCYQQKKCKNHKYINYLCFLFSLKIILKTFWSIDSKLFYELWTHAIKSISVYIWILFYMCASAWVYTCAPCTWNWITSTRCYFVKFYLFHSTNYWLCFYHSHFHNFIHVSRFIKVHKKCIWFSLTLYILSNYFNCSPSQSPSPPWVLHPGLWEGAPQPPHSHFSK